MLDYTGTLTTPTATVTTAKCLFNRVVSTPKATCVTADIKNFYLNNDLPDPEYMKMHMTMILDEICKEYNIKNFVDSKGWVYINICKGMYELKQACIIANQELAKHLKRMYIYQ